MSPGERAETPAGPVVRARAALERAWTPGAWRNVLAVLSGLITFMVTSGGLFWVAPRLQGAVVAGLAVGLVARRALDAGAIGAAVALAGALVAPANSWFGTKTVFEDPVGVIGSLALCAAVAYATRWASARYAKAPTLLLAAAILILVANFWYTPLKANSQESMEASNGVIFPPFNQQLKGPEQIPIALEAADGVLYDRIYVRLRNGEGFYAAFYDAYTTGVDRPPLRSVGNFRMPTLFWFWRVLPQAHHIVLAYLLLASLAVISVVPITSASVRLPLAIPGCAALTGYLTLVPTQFLVFLQEPWAALFGVYALAAYAVSTRSTRWKTWTLAAVSFAVLAVLIRESAAFLAIAGLASSLFGDRSQRGFRVRSWCGGMAVLVVAYTAQYFATKPYWSEAAEVTHVGEGGVRFMLAAFTTATTTLAPVPWLPAVLAVIGFAAALVVPDVRLRTFACVATFTTTASFLVLGNDAWTPLSKSANYWGMAIVPLLYALVPTVLVVIPGASLMHSRRLLPDAAPADAAATESEQLD